MSSIPQLAAFKFVSKVAEKSATKDLEDYFVSWSPYAIMRMHVKLLELNEVPRPILDLDRVVGSSKIYQFVREVVW